MFIDAVSIFFFGLSIGDERYFEAMKIFDTHAHYFDRRFAAELAGGADERALRVWSSFGLDILFCGGDWNFLYSEGKNTLERMKQARETYGK